MFVSAVHPVAMRSAVFCTVCSLFMDVFDAMFDHVVFAYSSIGLVTALYVVVIVSFAFPHLVVVSALMMFVLLFAFSDVFLICSEKVSLGSSVTPSTLGFLFVGMMTLSIDRVSVLLYSAGSGVNSVADDLSALSCRLFCLVQLWMSFR